jgi:release factor glutamine methyltransferase
VHWLCGDLVTALHVAKQRFALCVANLPYVTLTEWQHLPREIKDYEPVEALQGGQSGLDLIRRLLASSVDLLAPEGVLMLEVGWQQAAVVLEDFQRQGAFQALGSYQDYSGIARVVWGQVAG